MPYTMSLFDGRFSEGYVSFVDLHGLNSGKCNSVNSVCLVPSLSTEANEALVCSRTL